MRLGTRLRRSGSRAEFAILSLSPFSSLPGSIRSLIFATASRWNRRAHEPGPFERFGTTAHRAADQAVGTIVEEAERMLAGDIVARQLSGDSS